jgi:multimeric flavodoxin WrbA
MKNILVVSSSPRRGGNSDLLCDSFISGAKESGHNTEKLFLRDLDINYCTGCGYCINQKKGCAQKDDMNQILDKMINADVIVMATPVYFYTMCGQMKTFIDRICAKYNEIQDKEFYFIVSAADNNIDAMNRTIEEFRGLTYCLENPIEKGIVYGVGAYKVGDINDKPSMLEAYNLGKRA